MKTQRNGKLWTATGTYGSRTIKAYGRTRAAAARGWVRAAEHQRGGQP